MYIPPPNADYVRIPFLVQFLPLWGVLVMLGGIVYVFAGDDGAAVFGVAATPLVALATFLVFLSLQLDGVIAWSWGAVFVPFYVAVGYFVCGTCLLALSYTALCCFVTTILAGVLASGVLLYRRVGDQNSVWYTGVVFAPLYLAICLLACLKPLKPTLSEERGDVY